MFHKFAKKIMKKALLFLALILSILSCTEDRKINTNAIIVDSNSVLIHYWNFNATSGTLSSVAPDYTVLSSGVSIGYLGTGAGYMDSFNPGYTNNARNNDLPGNGLRTRNPSDTRYLQINTPTTGYKKIILQFATARSSSGAVQQSYSYTTDGTNYTATGLATTIFNATVDPENSIVSLDFSEIDAVNNNPNFKIRINFAGLNADAITGNNRFDNITVEGLPLSFNAPPSSLSYNATNNFTINTAITPLNPTVTGSVNSYSVSPALPSGLLLNTTSGSITGTPTVLSPATNYTITATNNYGTTSFITSISVSAVVDTTLYLIHYWNFNTLPTGTLTTVSADNSLITPNTTSITYPGSGAGYLDQVSPGSSLNTQNGAIDGLGLRIRNPSDTRTIIIAGSTVGYKNIVLKFATDRTSSGANTQNYSYTIDGTNYITTGLSTTTFSPNIDPMYDVITLDFSGISGAVNNANFKIKITFTGTNASGATGNNRLDNVTFQGNVL